MLLSPAADHKTILHRQLPNFEILITAKQQDVRRMYVEMSAVGVELSFHYDFPPDELFIMSIEKILMVCGRTLQQVAEKELADAKRERGDNALH